MTLALHLKVCGAALIALAALHTVFPKRFQWKEELARLSLLNRQIFWVHTLFIALVLIQFGVLSLVFTHALLERTALSKIILSGFVMFWGVRLAAQHFIYSPKIWRGNRFNTAMHVLFTGFWIYLVAVYAVALWGQYRNG